MVPVAGGMTQQGHKSRTDTLAGSPTLELLRVPGAPVSGGSVGGVGLHLLSDVCSLTRQGHEERIMPPFQATLEYLSDINFG